MTALLARVVRATAGVADRDVLLERVARLVLPEVDWVLADRVDEPDLLTRVVALGPDGPLPLEVGAAARRSSAGAVGLLPAVLAAPGRLLRLDAAALHAAAAGPDAHAAGQASTALALGAADLVVLALVARDRPVGVLVLASRSRLDDGLVEELATVGLHLAQALDAARLLQTQRAVATALQTSLLPPVPSVAGLALAARYAPAAHELEVGGDWYDAFRVPAGLVLVVGDVRGHDLAAAAQMADLRNLLRAHAVDRDEPPSALLSRLERTVAALGLDVAATLVVCLLVRDAEGGWDLTWSSAGHLPPVLVHEGRGTLLQAEPELLLGVEPGTARTDHSRRLSPGDTLVLCTDGLVEVRDEDLDTRLELLRTTTEQGAVDSPDRLAERLLPLAAGSTDDVALLVVRVL